MKTARNKGGILIDSVHMGEVEIDAISDPNRIILRGTAAYLNSETGQRFGSTTRNAWSPATLGRLQALLDSMEDDVIHDVFGESAAGGGGEVPIDTTGGIPGL